MNMDYASLSTEQLKIKGKSCNRIMTIGLAGALTGFTILSFSPMYLRSNPLGKPQVVEEVKNYQNKIDYLKGVEAMEANFSKTKGNFNFSQEYKNMANYQLSELTASIKDLEQQLLEAEQTPEYREYLENKSTRLLKLGGAWFLGFCSLAGGAVSSIVSQGSKHYIKKELRRRKK